MSTKNQRANLVCDEIPEIKEWEKALDIKDKNAEKHVLVLKIKGNDNKTVEIPRVISFKKIPLKKEVKYHLEGFLGTIKSDDIYDPEVCFVEADINFTRKTINLKTHWARIYKREL